eukprot:CAMPEP_0115128108 /NCGR_PEP_ID=MMETSP0227-20121206/50879_1 /TAXON_ID=89957 /ORGANISM="Polarella glacialis, Strain CCMP 1383" /LENGTH=217 /DNA_ID=CAMNT_0002532483 /DNA_START=66 /DNA_END=719 /DNA_ORIENTATION=+
MASADGSSGGRPATAELGSKGAAPAPRTSTTASNEAPNAVEELEDMVAMLKQLTDQRADLRKQHRKDDAQLAVAARRALVLKERQGQRFHPKPSWKRPKAVCEEFHHEGSLKVKYLEPMVASQVARPARTYEKLTSKAWIDGDTTPRLFGEQALVKPLASAGAAAMIPTLRMEQKKPLDASDGAEEAVPGRVPSFLEAGKLLASRIRIARDSDRAVS